MLYNWRIHPSGDRVPPKGDTTKVSQTLTKVRRNALLRGQHILDKLNGDCPLQAGIMLGMFYRTGSPVVSKMIEFQNNRGQVAAFNCEDKIK